MRRLASWAFLALGLSTAQAQLVRTGDHNGFGRVVLEFQAMPEYTVARSGDSITIRFGQPIRLPPGIRNPRNVIGLSRPEEQVLEVRVRAGADARHARLDTRLVIDIIDPGAVVAPVAGAQRLPARAAAVPADPPAPRPPERAAPDTGPSAADPARPPPVPVWRDPPPVVTAEPPPAAPPAVPAGAPAAEDHALVVPAPPSVGAAAFVRGNVLVVVFDAAIPPDLLPAAATVRSGPADATVVTFPTLGVATWALQRRPAGWALLPGTAAALDEPTVTSQASERRLHFDVRAPGRPVVLPDPLSGAAVLVGPVREASVAVASERRFWDGLVIPSVLGLVIDVRSDDQSLTATEWGFILEPRN